MEAQEWGREREEEKGKLGEKDGEKKKKREKKGVTQKLIVFFLFLTF